MARARRMVRQRRTRTRSCSPRPMTTSSRKTQAEEAAGEDVLAGGPLNRGSPDEAGDGLELVEADLPLGALPPGTSNRVVYAEELGALREGLRRYQFRVASSPVELAADTIWQQFLATFDRTYYVSATLRVAGRWQFIRGRLGLPAESATLELGTPFKLGEQAELVCLSDFPSWAEQSDGAMRTVAHQLAGYAREVIRPVPVPEGAKNSSRAPAAASTAARSF